MKHGKKSTAQRIFNDAMAELKVQELARIRKEAEVAAAKANKSDADPPSAIEHVRSLRLAAASPGLPLVLFPSCARALALSLAYTAHRRTCHCMLTRRV